MKHDILKLVEEQWLEDDGDRYYCPTEFAIHDWEYDEELSYDEHWEVWYKIRNFERIFEPWEIEQIEQGLRNDKISKPVIYPKLRRMKIGKSKKKSKKKV